jgi:quercetin dioxygenase-like cupin family protein
MTENRTALVLGAGEGDALWCAGALTTVKVGAEQGAGAFGVVEDLAPKGSGTPLHRHSADDEAFYVLEGEMTFFLGDAPPIPASAGSFVHIPGGTVHAFRVDSDTARYLIITTPHHVAFYRAMSDPASTRTIPPDEPLDIERIGAACEAYGVEGVGPVPDIVGE